MGGSAVRPSDVMPRLAWWEACPVTVPPTERDRREGVMPGEFVRSWAPIRTGTARLARDGIACVADRLGVPQFLAIVLLSNLLGVGKGELRAWAGGGIRLPARRSEFCDFVEALEARSAWLGRKFGRAFVGRA